MQRKIVKLFNFIISCSVNCYKTHKDTCSINQDFKDVQNEPKENNKTLNLDDADDIILEKQQLDGLKNNEKIMNMLKNKSLQKIIKHIDSTKYKKNTLEKMLKDSDFRKFVDEILLSLGYLKNDVFTY